MGAYFVGSEIHGPPRRAWVSPTRHGVFGENIDASVIRTEMSQINRIFGEAESSSSDIGSSQSLEGSEQNLFSTSWIPNSRIPRNGEKGTDAWESLPDYYDLGFENNGKISPGYYGVQ